MLFNKEMNNKTIQNTQTIRKLMIVESPAKIYKIRKILKDNWVIIPCYGHLEDLPEDRLGVKVTERTIEYEFVLKNEKKDVVRKIIELAYTCKEVYIATDPDREGEAIAYQISKYLPKEIPVYRVTFNALTEKEVLRGINNKRSIDINLVESQIARRVIDRLIGYVLSPMISREYGIPLAVGRVQSPVVSMIRTAFLERSKIKPAIDFQIVSVCYPLYFAGLNMPFMVYHNKTFSKASDAVATLNNLSNQFTVTKVKKTKVLSAPPKPLITATLQAEAYRRYGFTASRTMKAAQSLYEKGYCTYIRTDSPYISDEGYKLAEEYITNHFGKDHFVYREYKAESLAQEAHECIRPNYLDYSKEKLNDDEKKIMQLINEYFYASVMPDAIYEQTDVSLVNNGEVFDTSGKVLERKGYLHMLSKQEDVKQNKIPFLAVGQTVTGQPYVRKEKKLPPPLYNEADVIEKMKNFGIGRPSTYAMIIDTIRKRKYIQGMKGLKPTKYADYLVEFLSDPQKSFVLDVNYTQKLEERLDKIAKGEEKKENVIMEVYDKLQQVVAKSSPTRNFRMHSVMAR